MTEKHGNGFRRVVPFLPLIALALATAVAWGQQKAQTDAQEKRVEQNEKQVRQLSKGQATIMERTRQMQIINRENRDTLKEVLRELRRKR